MVTYVDVGRSRRSPAPSLRRHLALGLWLYTLLLSAGLSILVEQLAAGNMMQRVGVRLEQLSTGMRDRVEQALHDRFRALQQLARDEGNAAVVATGARRARFEALQQAYPAFAWIGLADPGGVVLAGSGGMFEGEDVSARPWFPRGHAAAIDGSRHAAAWPARADRPADGPLHYFVMSVPVRDGAGQVTGVLIAWIDWDALRELRAPLEGGALLLVVSRDGRVLSGMEALIGQRLALESLAGAAPVRGRWSVERWPDGDRYFTAASVLRRGSALPGPDWRILLRQDAGEVLDEIERLQLHILGAGAVLGLFFSGLAWWFAARVAAPLVDISAAADRLSAGERDVAIPAASGYREVEQLAASLRAMLSRLRRQEEDLLQARDKLELRVRERAAELTRTQAELAATVAEREHAQRELSQAKERLDLALDAAHIAVWTYDLPSGRVVLSEQWADLLGGARGATETTITDMARLVPEEERAMVQEAIDAAASGAVPQYVVRHHVRRANGRLVLTESRGSVVVRGADGTAVRMAGTVRALDEGVPAVITG